MNQAVSLLIKACIQTFRDNTERVGKCLDQLEERRGWDRPNNSSNSIGNQILHLCGNIRQYAIAGLGNLPDTRERDLEFSTTGGMDKKALWVKLQATVEEAIRTMERLDHDQLLINRKIQGFDHNGISMLLHVTEHYSYHLGQIAFWTKQILDKDLGFYADVDLNEKNITK